MIKFSFVVEMLPRGRLRLLAPGPIIAGIVLFLLALWLFGLPMPGHAQAPVEMTVGWIDLGQKQTSSLAWGDMDGDGDLDLAIANHDSSGADPDEVSQILRNTGNGYFVEIPGALVQGAGSTYDLAWGDMDGDGDLDLALANTHHPSQILRNEGGGAFSEVGGALGVDVKNSSSVAWGDVDGDGDLDLAVGNADGYNQLFRNDGGTVTEVVGAFGSTLSTTLSLDWGDMDGDGDLDLAVGNRDGVNQLFRNDGHGGFDEVGGALGSDDSKTMCVAWGDVDGDGDLDLAVGNFGAVNRLYENKGGVLFPEVVGALNPDPDDTRDLAWGDVDGDGDLDLAVGNVNSNQLYVNEAGGLVEEEDAVKTDPKTTWSVAWGDADGDGDLDLATGNNGDLNLLFRNVGGRGLNRNLRTLGLGTKDTRSVAWGDMEGDGDLDLVVGNDGEVNQIYRNEGGEAMVEVADALGVEQKATRSVAWGDANGDGYLDLAVGNWGILGAANQLYLNNGAGGFDEAVDALGKDSRKTWAVAWGDADGDGDLDLAVGNEEAANLLYLNDGEGSLTRSSSALGTDARSTRDLAWGDADGDGDLDLAVGNYQDQNQLLRNDGGGQFVEVAGALGPGARRTLCVSWGDADGDGDLDLAVGNANDLNQLYRNEGGGVFTEIPGTFGLATKDTRVMAWGDADGDGDLDMAIGSHSAVNLFYRNDGNMTFTRIDGALGSLVEATTGLAWGDMDGDGDLELAVGNFGRPNEVLTNARQGEGGLPNSSSFVGLTAPYTASADFYASPDILDNQTMPVSYTLFDPEGDPVGQVNAFYSPDGGGRWYGAEEGGAGLHSSSTRNLATGRLVRYRAEDGLPLPIPDEDTVTSTLPITETYQIADLDVWLAITHPNDKDMGVVLLSPSGTAVELFSGVGGSGADFEYTVLSDEAQTSIVDGTAPFTGTFRPEGSLFEFDGETTAGTWRLVVSDTSKSDLGTLVAWGLRVRTPRTSYEFNWDTFASGFFGQTDNMVLRLVAQPQPAVPGAAGAYSYEDTAPGRIQWPYASATTYPFRVRGTQVRVYNESVAPGNELPGAIVYRLPAGETRDGEPLADGSGEPFRTDIHGFLQGRGVVEIGDRLIAMVPVSATDSYTLYHTSAAPTATSFDVHTVSEPGVQELVISADNPLLLFDLDVSVEWDGCNDQQFRSQLLFDLKRASELLYDWTNGQVALGSVTVYHDREHWLDAHIRVYATNRLRPSAAQGGIVTEVYTDPLVSDILYDPGQVRMGAVWNRYGESEGNLGEDWPRTLAHELGHYALFLDDNYLGFDPNGLLVPVDSCTGTAMSDPYRDDYSEFHPSDGWLPGCQDTLSHRLTGRSDWETISAIYPWLDESPAIAGPSGLPLAVTQIQESQPDVPCEVLDVPVFFLSQDGHRVQPGGGARAFLFQGDWLTDLGRPTVDNVLARGARVGDRVCVFEIEAGRLGCETIVDGDEQLVLTSMPGWQPEVIVSPVTSRSITIEVSNVPAGLPLLARLFSVEDPAPPAQVLIEADGGYARTFDMPEPALEGYVQVWVAEEEPRREIVTDYALGGNPGNVRGRKGNVRGRKGNVRGRKAPALSADGQVILFGDDLNFGEGEFYALQAATTIPAPPAWATVVGQSYRLAASANAPNLAEASLTFLYMGNEVAADQEIWLKLYFHDGTAWQPLPTVLDTYHNYASAPAQGEGLYALMASIEIPLSSPGWNSFAYPVQGTRAVTEALLSISGTYSTVYGYEASDADDPWKVYDVTAPAWVNDLETLAFGNAYWINISEPVTLYLNGNAAQTTALDSSLPSPPATYYGPLLGGRRIEPEAGMAVAAQVEGNPCGSTQTIEVGGDVVYVVDVPADDGADNAGCGLPGRTVSFGVEGQQAEPSAAWSNDRLWHLALGPASQWNVYLPLVVKGY